MKTSMFYWWSNSFWVLDLLKFLQFSFTKSWKNILLTKLGRGGNGIISAFRPSCTDLGPTITQCEPCMGLHQLVRRQTPVVIAVVIALSPTNVANNLGNVRSRLIMLCKFVKLFNFAVSVRYSIDCFSESKNKLGIESFPVLMVLLLKSVFFFVLGFSFAAWQIPERLH